MGDLALRADRRDRTKRESPAHFEDSGVGCTRVIGEGAELSGGIQVAIGVKPKAVLRDGSVALPVAPHFIARDNRAPDFADQFTAREGAKGDQPLAVANSTNVD